MKKNLVGLLAIVGVALTGCSDSSTTKVKIFCSLNSPCLKCESLHNMNLENYNIISLECEALVDDYSSNYLSHCHYILTYRE